MYGVKCKLDVKIFKDTFQDLDAYMCTFSRLCQRLVNAIAQKKVEFILFGFFVLAKHSPRVTFEEFSAFSGRNIREIESDAFITPVGRLKALFHLKHFDQEILTVLTPIGGLTDVFRAWRKELHQLLAQWVSYRKLYAEPELYCVHRRDPITETNVYQRASQHNEEQHEIGKFRDIEPRICVIGKCQCLLSAHVSGIKRTASKDVAETLLKHSNDTVNQRQADCNNFCMQIFSMNIFAGL